MTEAWSRLGQREQEGGPVWCGKERPMMRCRHGACARFDCYSKLYDGDNNNNIQPVRVYVGLK